LRAIQATPATPPPASDPLAGSATGPLYFNELYELFIALGEGDTSVSLAPLRKAGSLIPPGFGALLVSFGIPAVRHQNLFLNVSVVFIPA
jgi:hypothetical protein